MWNRREKLRALLYSRRSIYLRRRRQRKRQKRVWIRPIFSRREQQGEYHNLLQEMRLADYDFHFRYLRMTKERFDLLVSKVFICNNYIIIFT